MGPLGGRRDAEDRAEPAVLDDRELAEHLAAVHVEQARVDLGPAGHGADVPQLVTVLGERARLHLETVTGHRSIQTGTGRVTGQRSL